MKPVTRALFATLLFVSATVAHANFLIITEDNDNLGFGTYGFGQLNQYSPDVAFEHVWTFSLAQDSSVTLSINNIPLTQTDPPVSFINIVGLELTLEDGGPVLAQIVHGDVTTVSGLQAGQVYTMTVTGVADGIWGGQYTGELTVVPLPAAAWLFGTALVGLAGVARRRAR